MTPLVWKLFFDYDVRIYCLIFPFTFWMTDANSIALILWPRKLKEKNGETFYLTTYLRTLQCYETLKNVGLTVSELDLKYAQRIFCHYLKISIN